jgi:hypothetical protein
MKYWRLIILALLLSACTSQPAAEPTGTPTHVESITPAFTDVIPSPTVPTLTEELPTPTRAVEINPKYGGDGLNEDGPWLLLSFFDQLWAVNSDGTGLTNLTIENFITVRDLEDMISPQGTHIAVRDLVDGMSRINLIHLPSGDFITLSPLIYDEGDDTDWSADAVCSDSRSVSWSPDGKYLAFIAKIDQPSADLYVYSMTTERVIRLTSGKFDAMYPTWSPDSKYILHAAGWHGTGAGHYMAEVWASRVSDGKNLFVYTPPPEDTSRYMGESGDETFLGWKNAETVIVTTWRQGRGESDLRSVNILNGNTRFYWYDWLEEVDISRGTKTALIRYSYWDEDKGESYWKIILIDLEKYTSWTVINEFKMSAIKDIWDVIKWSPELNAYILNSKEGTTVISSTGDIVVHSDINSVYIPVISTAGYWAWGWEDLWVGYPDGEHIQVYEKEIEDVIWSQDGNRIFFLSGDDYLTLYMADAPNFEPIPIAEGFVNYYWFDVEFAWASP